LKNKNICRGKAFGRQTFKKSINFDVRMLCPRPTFNFLFLGLLVGEKNWLAADFEADVADGLTMSEID